MKAHFFYPIIFSIIIILNASFSFAQEVHQSTFPHKSSITVNKKPLMEDFTSSTCSPCADLNEELIPWAEEHYDEFTLLKYPVNWPGVGDLYYTNQIGERIDFYGVTWVPSVYINGNYADWQFANIIPVYEEALNDSSILDIASSFYVTGSQINITTNIFAYADMNNVSVHTVVFEKKTVGNVGTNGETEFHHVVMKMIPNTTGTPTNFTQYETRNFSYTSDLSSTFIEEYDDLGVVIFIQDPITKEVFQSAYSLENFTYGNDATLQSISIDGVNLENFSPETFQYEVIFEEYPVDLPIISFETSDDNAQTIVFQCEDVTGDATVKVIAEDFATQNNYNIHFSIGTSTSTINHDIVQYVYPNPANGFIRINNSQDISMVEIQQIDGKVVLQLKSSLDYIPISNLKEGIYLVRIHFNNGDYKTEKLLKFK